MPAIHDFATWKPLLRLLRSAGTESLAAPGGHIAGRVGLVRRGDLGGRVVLYLLDAGSSAEDGLGPYPGSLILVEGSVPEPWHRLPDPAPDAVPAPSANPAALPRTLEERLDDAIGATDAEIAAAEERLGVALPDELKVLYGVTRGAVAGLR